MVVGNYDVAEFIHILVAVYLINYGFKPFSSVHFVEEHLKEDW